MAVRIQRLDGFRKITVDFKGTYHEGD
jgi:hypothetical protein